MFDNLVNHALRNVWCTPDQDKQLVIQPAKITGFGGVWSIVSVIWKTITLPLQRTRFHVYQIGQLYPVFMSLVDTEDVWMKLSEACNKGNIIVDIYAASGLQLPRTETWYMITSDRNVILAVKDQPNIKIDLNAESIFVRFYNNAYFASSRSDPLNDFILVEGGTVNTTTEILALQAKYNDSLTKPGATYAFVNGFKVSGIDLISVKPGDVAEFVYDSSIRAIVDLHIANLESFVSSLDNKHKYLVHYPAGGDSTIDYHDDIDFFLIKSDINNRHTGVYYHRNQEDAVRMVTHKDYSVVVPYVAGYVNDITGWVDPGTLTIRMHIRKSGYQRGLVYENNRIGELYKLPEDRIIAAMIGIDSTVPSWTAANLEASAYTELMRAQNVAVDRAMVQDAYGYNAISKLLGNTPSPTVMFSGLPSIAVPYALTNNAIAYEYSADGLLLGWHHHPMGSVYNAVDLNTAYVEMIAGTPGQHLDEYVGIATQQLDPSAEYRFYSCPITNGLPTYQWIDVTDTTDYSIVNSVATWNVNPLLNLTMIRSNKNVLSYDLSIPAIGGVLEFTLTEATTVNGVAVVRPMQIPLGELDLFLNGYSLIEDIDYVVNFPEVVVVNKAHLVNVLTDQQQITIRFSGFCNADLSRTLSVDQGFIKYGLLSYNNRFDIRDDKVLRIVVGGKLYTREMLKFSETDSGVTVPNATNGLPYLIRDIVVPLRGMTVNGTYVLRAAATVIDKSISDYMTAYMPEPQVDAANVIITPYVVYSPFCSKILNLLSAGIINDPRLKQQYSDQDVIDICQPYEYLLNSDLSQTSLKQDPIYVEVHPHSADTVINLDLYQYKFITRVVRLYLNGIVDISHFVNITQ